MKKVIRKFSEYLRTEVSSGIPRKGHSSLYENFEQQSVINHILRRDCSFHGRMGPEGRSKMTSKVSVLPAEKLKYKVLRNLPELRVAVPH